MNLIKKLFIKNYQDVGDSNVRVKYGLVASIFGIISNLILFIAKIIIGIISFSITIIADAINNLSDVLNSVLLIVGFKLSSKPADKRHPFGHARIEQIMALIISVVVLMIGAFLFETSIEKLIFFEEVKINNFAFIVLGVSILIKFFQMLLYKNFAKTINSDILKASSIDSRNDCIINSFIILAIILIKFVNIPFSLDGLFGLIISIYIIMSSIKLIINTTSPLLGEQPKQSFIQQIKNEILCKDKILGVHDLLIHSYGYNNYIASCDVEMNEKNNIIECHKIVDQIEREFKEKYNIILTIHIDPIQIDNKLVKLHKQKVLRILQELDKNISIHDFKMIFNKNSVDIFFDVILPYENSLTQQEIINILKYNYKNYKKQYNFILNIDKE